MQPGLLVSIHIAVGPEEPMQIVQHTRAVAGKGLEGDRYFYGIGTFSGNGGPDREITLIELEAIEAFERDYGVQLDAADARRNLVTRGVALNHLVDRKFKVGQATLQGIRLCEPCNHLTRVIGRQTIPGLIHRGGLRAQILTDGLIQVGDPVEVL
ncbi:MAG: MOSC domain-containing protein [Gemmatimonadaceae bacterium]|nr:MOSC domain-containing protein [Gloeobacterales cyanobacterium ES-bin-141]